MRVTTRTIGPRRAPTSGVAAPSEILPVLSRVALIAPSPHVAAAVARTEAGPDALVLDAARGRPPGWSRPELLVLHGVRGSDAGSQATALGLAAEFPDTRIVVACDRVGALALRAHGYRMVPLACPDGSPNGPVAPGAPAAAMAAFESDGDPLTCPVGVVPDPNILPVTLMSDDASLIWADTWYYTRALAEAFCARSGTVARVPLARLTYPAVVDALDRWAARRGRNDFGYDDDTDPATAAVVLASVVRGGTLTGRDRERARALAECADELLHDVSGFEPAALPAVADALDELDRVAGVPQGARKPTEWAPGLSQDPVTVRNYATFVADGAYHDARWWSADAPVEVTEPAGWTAQLHRPGRPVVGISWYEAEAFTRWASARSNRTVAIQSAAERRAASASPYPWGMAEPDSCRANFDQHVGHPTSVRAYPWGRSPAGHHDLSGNVWEWTRDTDKDTAGVVSGGWFSTAECTTTKYTFDFHRANRFDDLGFRVSEL